MDMSSLGKKLIAKHDASGDADTIWSAIGQPLSRIGAGRYKLTAEYLMYEKGALSTKSQQIRTREIFDVDANQSLQQKARGVGTITLLAKRPGGDETVLLEDVPNFRDGVAAINRVADEARESLRVRENTQKMVYEGAPPTTASAPTPTSVDLNTELAKLAAFHEQGVLSDVEFTSAKAKLLGI